MPLDIPNLREGDVVCGHGHFRNGGNARCHQMVQDSLEDYMKASTAERATVIQGIYQAVRSNDGRFVEAKTHRVMGAEEGLGRIRRMFRGAITRKNDKLKQPQPQSTTTTDNNTNTSTGNIIGIKEAPTEKTAAKKKRKAPPSQTQKPEATQEAKKTKKEDPPAAGAGAASASGKNPPSASAVARKPGALSATSTTNTSSMGGSSLQKKEGPPKVVARNRLLRGSMTEEHALKLLECDTIPSSDDPQAKAKAAQSLLLQLHDERKDVKDWAKKRLMQAIAQWATEAKVTFVTDDPTTAASSKNKKNAEQPAQPTKTTTTQVTVVATKWEHVVQSWVQNPSVENHRKIHAIVHKPFQPAHTSIMGLQLEQEYMEQHHLVYPPESKKGVGISGSTGYVYDIIKYQLNMLQQELKRKGVVKHSIWMGKDEDERFYQAPDKTRVPLEMVEGSSAAYPNPTAMAAASAAAASIDNNNAAKKKTPTKKPNNKSKSIKKDANNAAEAAQALASLRVPSKNSSSNNNNNNNTMPVPTAKDVRSVPNVVTCDNASLATEETTGFSALASFPVIDNYAAAAAVATGRAVANSAAIVTEPIQAATTTFFGKKWSPLVKAHMTIMAVICFTIFGMYQLKPMVNVLIAISD